MPASPNVGNYPFPFKHIPDISSNAAREIRRNFEALLNIPSNSQFDAIIDPTLASSSHVNHQYKNLTDLVASESWPTTHTFRVGVKTQAGISITETSPNDISAQGDLVLFGLGEPIQDATHVGWSWLALACAPGQQVYYYNLSFGGNGSALPAIQQFGLAFFDACYFGALVSGLHNTGAGGVTARDCKFHDTIFVNAGAGSSQTHYYFGCEFVAGLSVSTNVTAYVQGGAIGTGGASTLTVQGSGIAIVSSSIEADLSVTSTAAASSVINNVGGQGGNVSVSATVPQVVVTGEWASVTFSGTPAAARRFAGSCSAMDFTGPGKLDLQNTNSSFGNKVTLRGDGIRADLHNNLGSLSCIGMTNSGVWVVIPSGSGGSVTVDSGSRNSVIVIDGKNGSAFGGITNNGVNVRIITEDTDSLTSILITNLLNGGGLRGRDGIDGEDGMDGFPGPPGGTGPQGAAGVGARGQAGEDGEDGLDGLPGPQGAPGGTGPQGVQGKPVDGIDGEDGLDGFPGPRGATGLTGSQGAIGIGTPGIDGEDGLDGFPGPPGVAGAIGPQGAAGTGAQGKPGEDGDDGFDGYPGPRGLTGLTGAQGGPGIPIQGQDGEDGLDGFPGPPGKPGRLKCTSSTRPTNPIVGDEIYETDTGNTLIFQSATTGWTPPWNTSWGLVASNQQSADTAFTTVAEITGTRVTWTAVANRLYRTVHTGINAYHDTATGQCTYFVADVSGVAKGRKVAVFHESIGLITPVDVVAIESGLSGSTTRILAGVRDSGAGNGHAFEDGSYGAISEVYDIGPNGAPV